MKRLVAIILLLFLFSLLGCSQNSMNYIIQNKPSVTGIAEEVHDAYILLYSDSAAGYPNGSTWSIPLKVENQDSYLDIAVGDEIVVYFDGTVMETSPLQIGTVYAITLKTPANRGETTPTGYPSDEIQQPQIRYDGKLFFYFATGFDEPLPKDYIRAGSVAAVDNTAEPAEDFHGARVETGQDIYASDSDPDTIYVEYEKGYAAFSVRK